MAQAGTATVKFVGDYSQMNAGLASALAPARLKKSGMKAGLAIGGAIAAAGVAKGLIDAVNVTKEFEKQMSSLGSVTDANSKQMDRLRKQAIRMGAATVFSASEAAKAQIELAKGGLNTSQILGGALKSSLSLAAAGELELADAATTVVNSMQLFGLQGKATGRIADMLATAANKTTADVLDFSMALKQGGAVAKTAGYSLNDTVIILEALAEAGIKNSDAGTSMKASLIQLLNPTAKQVKLAAELGVSWVKQNGELKNGIEISKALKTATADMTKAERTKTFAILAGTDGFRTLSALYDAGVPKLRSYARANLESGTAAEVAAKKTDNLAGDIEGLSGAWETFQITVGSKVTPILRDLTQAATEAVNEVTKIFNAKNLSNGEKFNKLVKLGTEAAIKGLEELTKAAVKAAPEVASAFASGFASAPIWMQLAGAGLMLKMFGGPAGVAAAGTSAAGIFTGAFQTYTAARTLGGGRAASASLALPWVTSVFASMKRIIPQVAAAFAISDVISTVLTKSLQEAVVKVGVTAAGALIGGAIGSVFPGVGTAIGAAIGGGIGAGLSGPIQDLFGGGGEVEKTLRDRIRESTKRLREGIRAEVASIANFRAATQGQVKARHRQKVATHEVERAQRALNRAVRQHGPASDQATLAQVRYKIALDKTREAENRLRKANRLQGAVRRATIQIMRNNVQEGKFNIAQLRQEREQIIRNIKWGQRRGESVESTEKRMRNLNRTNKQLKGEQERVNKIIQRAGTVIGPKFARSLEKISSVGAAASRVMPQLSRATETSMSKSRSATGKASLKFEAFGDVVLETRKRYGSNMRAMPKVTVLSTDAIQDSLSDALEAIQNTGRPQSKRRGGLIERVRQAFRGGGVPVAVSPGELFKTPDGKAGIVPGKPTAADNVLTSMPVGTKVFTFDGQRRLMEGASEQEALRDQLPHFASGGIVKPEVVGGTKRSAEVANAAITKVHDRAKKKLQREKQAAAAASSGVPGYVGPPANMQQLGNNAWVDSHTLAVGAYLVNKFGVQITDGWRPQNAGYGAVNSSHKRGTSDNPGALDFAPPNSAMQAWAGAHIAGLTENDIHDWGSGLHNHIAFFRKGGILEQLQRGGLVKNPWFNKKTKRGNINGIWPSADLTKNSSGWHALPTLPPYVFGALAEAAGRHFNIDVPGKAMMQMIMHEGGTPEGGKPGSRGTDPGGTVGYGPWAITTSYNDALVRRFGGSYGAMNNPVLNAAAMAHIVRDQGLGAWYGDQYVTDPSAHWKGSYQLRNALGGIGYSAALRSAMRGKYTGDEQGESSGPSPADKRKSRRESREEQVQDLLRKAFASKSAKSKKGAYWQILDLYARYGDFGWQKGGITGAGGIGPGLRTSEAAMFLQRAGGIASILDPNRGSGQLYQLVKWLQGNVEMTGSDDANDRLAGKLKAVRERQAARVSKKRKKILKGISSKGIDYPNKKYLMANDRHIRTTDEWIELAARAAGQESGPGGSEYTDAEVDYEKRLNLSLLESLRDRKGLLAGSLKFVRVQRENLLKRLESAPAWRKGAIRKALGNTKTTLGDLNSSWEELVGLTGQGGRIGDVKATLEELGFRTTVEKQAAQGISIGDLRQIVEFASLGGYENLPMFHGGGVYKAPPGRTEGPALLKHNETIRTPEQERALRGDVKVEVNFADGMGWLEQFVDVTITENDRRANQFVKAGGV